MPVADCSHHENFSSCVYLGYPKERLEPIAPHLFCAAPCEKQVLIFFIASLQILKHGDKGSSKSFLTW